MLRTGSCGTAEAVPLSKADFSAFSKAQFIPDAYPTAEAVGLTRRDLIRGSGVRQEETQQGVFGPVAVVAIGLVGVCEEGAMASVLRFDQGDV